MPPVPARARFSPADANYAGARLEAGARIRAHLRQVLAAAWLRGLPPALTQRSSIDQRRVLVEHPQDLLATAVWYLDEHPLAPGPAVGGQRGRAGWRGESGDRQGLGIAASCGSCLPQPLCGALGFEAAPRPREPPVAKLHHALERVVALAAK